MSKLNPYFRIVFLFTLLFLLASCTTQVEPGATEAESSTMSEEDHGDEDHDDEDHDDEGHDDEGHDDEGHDDEGHDDEGHDDEGHDDEHREHDAHEHGTAELTVALIDGQAEIALETPAFNLVGFEYAPSSDEEIAAVDEATANLEKGEWFTLSNSAGCSLNSIDVFSTMAEKDHDDEDHEDEEHKDEDHEDEETERHSSFFATYTFDCSSLENLAEMDATTLFATFPNFEDVDVQWLNDTQQSAATLDKDQPVLSFE